MSDHHNKTYLNLTELILIALFNFTSNLFSSSTHTAFIYEMIYVYNYIILIV